VNSLDALLANPQIVRLRAALSTREAVGADDEHGVRRAAVALTLRGNETGSPELLFIKRADYPGDPWSGQVAFPGGREEPGDRSLLETAIRETREETGVDLEREGKILGTLDDLRPQTTRLPAVVVRPFVAVVTRDEPLLLSAEAALAFWVPLDALNIEDAWRDTPVFARGIQINRRAFHHDGHVIWGMTERILAQFLQLVRDDGASDQGR
jgi:8-oxo-dGTP pyrophosphatase MutT (NUDIX family)